jgi:hypothetical protein
VGDRTAATRRAWPRSAPTTDAAPSRRSGGADLPAHANSDVLNLKALALGVSMEALWSADVIRLSSTHCRTRTTADAMLGAGDAFAFRFR